jgi:hypothetical protein
MKEAERIKNLLSGEGFLVRLKPVGLSHHNECGPVEILVPESEAEEAMETMTICKLTGKQGTLTRT